MTPVEKTIVKSLVAVAWADGTLAEPESGVIDSLLWAFGASDESARLRPGSTPGGSSRRRSERATGCRSSRRTRRGRKRTRTNEPDFDDALKVLDLWVAH